MTRSIVTRRRCPECGDSFTCRTDRTYCTTCAHAKLGKQFRERGMTAAEAERHLARKLRDETLPKWMQLEKSHG